MNDLAADALVYLVYVAGFFGVIGVLEIALNVIRFIADRIAE